MSADFMDAVVAALRDTSAKVAEMTKTENTHYQYNSNEKFSYSETYSRSWIAGRLLGMADMIDVLHIKRGLDNWRPEADKNTEAKI